MISSTSDGSFCSLLICEILVPWQVGKHHHTMKIRGRGERCDIASFVSVGEDLGIGEGFIEGIYEMQQDMYACMHCRIMQVVTGTAMRLSNTGAFELRPFPCSGCEERMPECNVMLCHAMPCYAMLCKCSASTIHYFPIYIMRKQLGYL